MTEFSRLRDTLIERTFARMNERQREAVFCTEGPLLLLAGAGSGKTTVLVNRIAYILRFGKAYGKDTPGSPGDVEALRHCLEADTEPSETLMRRLAVDPCEPWRVLAITFTNKAAGELKERLCRLLGDTGNKVVAGTFHSFCAKLLRSEADKLGYARNFTIYDTDDSTRLMKECLKTLRLDDRIYTPRYVLAEIGRAKDTMLPPAGYAAAKAGDFRAKDVARSYELYQKQLHAANAMDFDDLIYNTVRILTDFPAAREQYAKRFRYILVDEYQDTSHAQFLLVSLLAGGHGNLCVVGDDDQSIYKFRGATIENILNFEEHFPGCRLIRLEQNYRSTKTILDAANAVIAQNTRRKGKTLWTDNQQGEKVELREVANEDEEGRFIADTALAAVAAGGSYRDMAVLYRMNAQSNAIERALVKSGVPYRIVGGHRFNDSQEVRDATAYLRLLHNPDDVVSLRRVINTPRRGIGGATLDKAAEIADNTGETLPAVLAHAADYPALSAAAKKLSAFFDMLQRLRTFDGSLTELYAAVLEQTGYLAMWEQQGEPEAHRVDNLRELASSVARYEEEAGGEATLSGFLEENALVSDIDNYDSASDALVLMTMHAAKGLEFPAVFLPGFEDGIFPGQQSLFLPEEMEEDRRLCYVALTRAKEKLYILHAISRMLFGQTMRHRVSRFLRDIPEELLDEPEPRRTTYGGYGGYSGYGSSDGNQEWGGISRTVVGDDGWNKNESDGGDSPSRRAAAKAMPHQSLYQSPDARHLLDLLPKQAPPPFPLSRWKAGDAVRHGTFGDGVITAVASMGQDQLLTVDFDKAGTKKIMANFAKLAKI